MTNELPAETQTLRGHNSAPHATETLRPRLIRSSQLGEHICMKFPAFLRPSFSWLTHRRQVSTAVFLEINESCNIAQPELALRHIFKITINGH